MSDLGISAEKLAEMYATMLRIRRFEERVADIVMKGRRMMAHLYIGEEAVATGVCAALRSDDYVSSTHRGHGHCIAKGTDVKYMMAELFGKRTGTNKGKGGSMHIAKVSAGNLGANGIVGGSIPTATGAGLSIKLRGTDQVSVCFFGDGGSNQGVFHESLNIASIFDLPVLFICENNMYAISTPISYAARVANISERAAAYRIPGVSVDGMDVIAVYKAAQEAVSRARKGQGPTLLECKTYRYRGHAGPYEMEPYGDRAPYRSKEELESWKKRDAILKLRKLILEKGILSEDRVKQIDDGITQEIEDAVKFAIESPDPSPEEALEDLLA